mgnify:CR=1 FL=1
MQALYRPRSDVLPAIARSRKFFAGLGYSFNETFSSDNAVTLVLGENQFAMLTRRDVFDSLHPAETADASKTKECVVCLAVDSRECVDKLVDAAQKAFAHVRQQLQEVRRQRREGEAAQGRLGRLSVHRPLGVRVHAHDLQPHPLRTDRQTGLGLGVLYGRL